MLRGEDDGIEVTLLRWERRKQIAWVGDPMQSLRWQGKGEEGAYLLLGVENPQFPRCYGNTPTVLCPYSL